MRNVQDAFKYNRARKRVIIGGAMILTCMPAYSTADYADDIRAAAEILGGREIVLVSHSNGSLASLYFATHLEPKPKALVYMDVNPRVLDEQVEYFRQRAIAVTRVFP